MAPTARVATFSGLLFAALLAPAEVHAKPIHGGALVPAEDERADPSIDERQLREGVVIGFVAGAGLAGASGYPNASSQIGDPAYYSSSNLMAGGGGSAFVMGALADYLNVGFWGGFGTFESNHWRSTGGGGGIRLEVFPLYALVPRLQGLGLATQLGLGTAKLAAKEGNYPSADGAQSFASIGVFYELSLGKLLGGHLTVAPSFEYDAIFTRPLDRNSALLGARVAFYGGR